MWCVVFQTPLQNDLQELWSLLNFLHPNMFTAAAAENFEKWFSSPFSGMALGAEKEKHTAVNEEEKLLIIDCLHSFLLQFMLRREKKDVETQLANKIEKILRCDLSPVQAIQYKKIVTGKVAMHNRMVQRRKLWYV